jgi:hypothetical protein
LLSSALFVASAGVAFGDRLALAHWRTGSWS